MPRTRPGASILHCDRDALHAVAPSFNDCAKKWPLIDDSTSSPLSDRVKRQQQNAQIRITAPLRLVKQAAVNG